jgi:hypothetical protein
MRPRRYGRYRRGAAAVYVHRPRAMEFLGESREEKNSRTCCVPGDAGDEGLCPRRPWWGEVKRGGDSEGRSSQSATDLEDPNYELNISSSPLTMSIAHGIKTLGVIGAGQMGMFSSFAILSTSLPVVQGLVLPMWPH